MKKILTGLFFIAVFSLTQAKAHCQVPCGIYDDHARIHMIQEHVQTMTKARKMIIQLQSEKRLSKRNENQIVRWIMTKENHASEIQDIVTDYFLTQRVKLDWSDKKRNMFLNQLHSILVYAMKCKQSLDEEVYSKLNQAVNRFEKAYMDQHAKGKK